VVANLYTLLVYAALGGATFYLALYLQSGAVGYSPTRASLIFLPISIVMFFIAARFGRLSDQHGPRRYLTVAPLVMALGFVMLTFVTGTNLLTPLPGVLVMSLGLAMLVAPITSTALKAAPDRFAGLAAGVNTTVSRLGGLIATPLLGVVITLVFTATASPSDADPFAKHLNPDQQQATIDAFRAAIAVAVALCLAGSLLAARELREQPAAAAVAAGE
jgi:MFS family permease